MPKDKPEAFDLSSLDTSDASDKGARVELVHPTTAKPLGMFVTVLGKHSQVFRDIIRDRVNRRVRDEANANRRGKQPELMTAEQVEHDAIELLVACTLGWDSGTDKPTWLYKGEELTFTVPNAIKIYTEMLWIREQVDNAIGDLENFIKA
jgi:hypothetical protein